MIDGFTFGLKGVVEYVFHLSHKYITGYIIKMNSIPTYVNMNITYLYSYINNK